MLQMEAAPETEVAAMSAFVDQAFAYGSYG